MEYFCQYLSIDNLGSANPSHGDKNSGEDSFLDAVMAARGERSDLRPDER